MENANSKDYLEKIKIQVIENLKKTAHAPSVQMTDVPRTTIMGGTDEDEAELDDLDEDENKDVRSTKRQWDQRITRDDELDESEDEEENRANGIRPQNGVSKRRNMMDYQTSNPVASDVDMDSGVGTPLQNEVDDMVSEANAAVNAEVMENKTLTLTTVETGEAGPSNAPSRSHSAMPPVDNEGDVDMTEPAPAPVTQVPTPEDAPISPTATATVEPAPTTETEAEPDAQAEAETEALKEEGEAERQDEDIAGELSKEMAEQSEP